MRQDLKIKILNNERYLTPQVHLSEAEKQRYIPPVVDEWYTVTDVHQPPRSQRREGIDRNVYFININGIRMGVHGVHCETNGYDAPSHAQEFFEKFREEMKEKEEANED